MAAGSAGVNGEGAAYLMLGPWTSGGTYDVGETAHATVVGDDTADHVGDAVGFAGDLLGTGAAHFVVGSAEDDLNAADAGSVAVVGAIGL